MMCKKYANICMVLLFIVLTTLGCGDRKIIARVGNRLIRAEDFKNSFMTDKAANQANKITFDKQMDHLSKMIDEELKLIDAYATGLDQDTTIIKALKSTEREKLSRYTVNKEVIDKIISNKMLRSRYVMNGTEIKIKQIFLPIATDMAENKKIETKTLLESIRQRILAKENFEDLAREFSKDSLTAGKGGEVGFIKYNDTNYGQELFKAAFSLKIGQLSQVIETKKGFHIIQVENRREIPQDSLEKQKETLTRSFYKEKRNELNKTFKEFLEKLKMNSALRFNDQNIEYLLSLASSDSTQSDKRKYFKVTQQLSDDVKSKILAEYTDKKFTINDFIQQVEKSIPSRKPYFENVDQMKKFIENRIVKELVINWGYSHGYENNREITLILQDEKEKLMIKKVEEMQVLQKAEPSDEEAKKYFNENKAKFVNPPLSKVQEIFVRDAKLARLVAVRAKKGENFNSLAAQYNERRSTKRQNGMLGYVAKEQYGAVGKAADKMKVRQISDIINMGQGYSIIKILDKQPQKYLSFDEASARVKMNVRLKNREAIKKEWMDNLKKRYAVEIYKKALKEVLGKNEL
jgi:peptidyl-prolyl cis-trans isomerase SurA